MRKTIARLLACVVAVPVAMYLFPEHIIAPDYIYAAIAGAALGLIHIFIRPIAKVVLGIFNVLTLGIIYILLDAWLVQLCSWLVGDYFYVASFWWALVVSIIVNILRSIMNAIFR